MRACYDLASVMSQTTCTSDYCTEFHILTSQALLLEPNFTNYEWTCHWCKIKFFL